MLGSILVALGSLPSTFPVRERHRVHSWDVAVRSDVGAVRTRLEDAWAVLSSVPMGGRSLDVFAVFDGLGGLPHGQEAAWGAAEALSASLQRSTGPSDVLHHLHGVVEGTGGATTAVVALFPTQGTVGEGVLVSAGDSAAYMAGPAGQLRLLVPKDAEGPSIVTQCLGREEPQGHVVPCSVPRGGTLLLCTDGVDGVVEPDRLVGALRSADLAAALEDVFSEIWDRGAPDNATVVLARRLE